MQKCEGKRCANLVGYTQSRFTELIYNLTLCNECVNKLKILEKETLKKAELIKLINDSFEKK